MQNRRLKVVYLAFLLICCLQANEPLMEGPEEPMPFQGNSEPVSSGQLVVTDDGLADAINPQYSDPENRKLYDDIKNRYYNIIENKFHNIRFVHPRPVKADECDLSIEIFPLYYIPIIRSSTLRIKFSSNCLTKRDHTFEVSYHNHRDINWFYHPTNFYLNLWGNVYRLEFKAPRVVDRYDIMKSLEYMYATVHNILDEPRQVNLHYQNNVYLHPQERQSFNPFNIEKIQKLEGYSKCVIRERKMKNWQKLMSRKRTMIETLSMAGYKDEELDQMIRQRMDSEVSASAMRRKPDENYYDLIAQETPSSFPDGKNANFEKDEEKVRLTGREKALERLKFNFIDEIDVECFIS